MWAFQMQYSAETCLRHCRTSMMTFFCNNSKHIKAVNNFCKTAPSQIFYRILNTYHFSLLEIFKLLTLIWVGFLGVRSQVRRVKLPPPLSETCQNYARNLKFGAQVLTYMQFSKIYLQYQGLQNFADVSIFFAKKSAFLARNSTYTPSNSCVKDLVILFSVFLR